MTILPDTTLLYVSLLCSTVRPWGARTVIVPVWPILALLCLDQIYQIIFNDCLVSFVAQLRSLRCPTRPKLTVSGLLLWCLAVTMTDWVCVTVDKLLTLNPVCRLAWLAWLLGVDNLTHHKPGVSLILSFWPGNCLTIIQNISNIITPCWRESHRKPRCIALYWYASTAQQQEMSINPSINPYP